MENRNFRGQHRRNNDQDFADERQTPRFRENQEHQYGRNAGYLGGRYEDRADTAGAGGFRHAQGQYEPEGRFGAGSSGYQSDEGSFGTGFTQSRAETNQGKGPKNYQRTDERIREDLCNRMCDDRRLDASDIEVTISNAEVTLTGTVRDLDAKRRAAHLAEETGGVRHVENKIRVQEREEFTGSR